MTTSALARDLAALVGTGNVLSPAPREYLTEASGHPSGPADAVVLPGTADEAAAVVAWCYERDVAMVPRGGGTGYAGGTAADGGIVIGLERMVRIRAFDPLQWRICVEAGLRTADLRRTVRESGLYFPPDPGAGEQSQIGGNLATNAGGPHAFKYGVTGRWVTGVEAVLAPGRAGHRRRPGPQGRRRLRPERASYGAEGTLGLITAAWLRLVPAPEAAHPIVAFYPSADAGCAAIEAVFGNGIEGGGAGVPGRGRGGDRRPGLSGRRAGGGVHGDRRGRRLGRGGRPACGTSWSRCWATAPCR